MDLLKGLQAIFGGKVSASRSSTPKDESLRHQENDLYKTNIRLREQLDEARERIVQLENQIYSMAEESTKLEKNWEARRDEIGQMTAQFQKMIKTLDEKMKQLEVKVDGQFTQMKEDTRNQLIQNGEDIRSQFSQMEEEIRSRLSQIGEGNRSQFSQIEEEIRSQLSQMQSAEELSGQIENALRPVSAFEKTAGQVEQIRNSVKQLESLSSSAGKIDGIHSFMQQLDGVTQETMQQIAGLREMAEKMEEQQVSIAAAHEVAEGLKSGITEKIHDENVKCYRNMKNLVADLEAKMEQMELGEESLTRIRKSFRGMKFFSFFSLLSFLAILAYILAPMIWW